MANKKNYKDIPTGEEQGLISDTRKSVATKNNVKLLCAGILCIVVAFLGGSLHSRNAVASMVGWGDCVGFSNLKEDGFCLDGLGFYVGCETTGVPECLEQGGGLRSCSSEDVSTNLASKFNTYTWDVFYPNEWKVGSCSDMGYKKVVRLYDISRTMPERYHQNTNLQEDPFGVVYQK